MHFIFRIQDQNMKKALADCLPKAKALPAPEGPDNGSVATKGKPTLENKMALQAY